MTARLRRTVGSLALVVLGAAAGCTNYFEIPIETPIPPKLDTAPFQRVLVAGFIAGGTQDVDSNLETVRLLRSQLRTRSNLRVIDADALPLIEVAEEQGIAVPEKEAPPAPAEPAAEPAAGQKPATETPEEELGPIKDENDLEAFQSLFANVEYWKRIGEEYQQPLIVTGTVLFTPHQRSGFVQREQEVYDSFGRRRTVPVRTYQERKGYILRPTFIFIDGRTGETLHSETFREEVLYSINQSTPALSSYFELMDRLLPTFLNTLSAQKIRGTRTLLK
ncbi:MAG: hypothetical protein AB7O67_03760 [Vicinamibacterales bacterium]